MSTVSLQLLRIRRLIFFAAQQPVDLWMDIKRPFERLDQSLGRDDGVILRNSRSRRGRTGARDPRGPLPMRPIADIPVAVIGKPCGATV